jgi:gliding motility-associated-like protein
MVHEGAFCQTADISAGCAPLEVNFTPRTGTNTFFWNFGDNSTSTIANPSHIFLNEGTYAVTFRATQNGPVLGTVSIRVFKKPDVLIAADKLSGCVPLEVNFKDSSLVDTAIKVQSYSWTFGNGTGASGASAAALYNSAGTFSVSLALKTNYPSCDVTRIFAGYVKTSTSPFARFNTNPNPPTSCSPPLTVNFENTSTSTGTVTYLWDFGNGQTSILKDPPSQTYIQNGRYVVRLTVTDVNGCSGAFERVVNVGKPAASFVVPDTVCAGPVLFINTSTPGRDTFTFGSLGNRPDSVIGRNVIKNIWTEGTYTITLKVTDFNNRCDSVISKTIFVDAVDASFTLDPTYSCKAPFSRTMTSLTNEPVTHMWQYSDGSTARTRTATHTWVNPDTSTYSRNGVIVDTITLTVTNARGCRGFELRLDTIQLPNALFAPDTTMGCAPLDVNFFNQSTSHEPIVKWTYWWGDGRTDTYTSPGTVSHTYTSAGDYDAVLIIENAKGCTDTSFAIRIEVGEPLTADFAVDKTLVCPSDTVFFTDLAQGPDVDAWHYSTGGEDILACPDEPNPFHIFRKETGPQDVTLTVLYNGCPSSITKTDLITVQGPIATVDYKIDCAKPLEVQFFDSLVYEATSVKWFFGNGDSSTLRNPVHVYDSTGDYQVILLASNPATGCADWRDTAMVHVRQVKADFKLADDYCVGLPFDLDASKSQDVNATCWKGYTWLFTDSRPITTQDSIIEYAFQSRDTQIVTLVVEDINGCRDTLSDTTAVYQAFAVFNADDLRVCMPALVRFTDLSYGDTTLKEWEWKFGDGAESTERNPSHTFRVAPTPPEANFYVTLIVRDIFGCTGEQILPISVYTPNSRIITDPIVPNICASQVVNFAATDFTEEGSSLKFNWNFGNGRTSINQSETVLYDRGGRYEVRLQYEENGSGCSGATTTFVNVQDYPQARFISSVDNQSPICYPEQISFTDRSTTTSNLNFRWNFGNGSTGPDAPVVSSVFGKGNFTVTMIASTSYGCADTTSRNFTLVGPEGSFGFDKLFICRGGSITFALKDTNDVSSYTWDFRDGTTIDNRNPVTHTFNTVPPGGKQDVVLVLRGEQDACEFFVTQSFTMSEVKADFETQGTLCKGVEITFVNKSSADADTYRWTFGDNSAPSTQASPKHIFANEGTYNVTLIATDANTGCTDTITKAIVITPSLSVNVAAQDARLCPGEQTQVSVTNGQPNWNYIWSPAAAVVNPNAAATFTNIVATQTLTVNVIDDNGCRGTATTTVTVVTDPGIQADSIASLARKGAENVPLTPLPAVVGNLKITWSNTSELNLTDTLKPIVNKVPDESRTYMAFVVDDDGCFRDTFDRTIIVYDIPNIFTPDGDGINDFFNITAVNLGDVQIPGSSIVSFRLFNRWGQQVYNNENPNKGWDGEQNGKPAPSDVYAYVVEVRLADGTVLEDHGDVTLLR